MINFENKTSVPRKISQKYIEFFFNNLLSKGIDVTEEGYNYFYDLIPKICEELSYGDLDFEKIDLYIFKETMKSGNIQIMHLSKVLGDIAKDGEAFVDHLCNMILDGEAVEITNLDFHKLKAQIENLEREVRIIKMLLR